MHASSKLRQLSAWHAAALQSGLQNAANHGGGKAPLAGPESSSAEAPAQKSALDRSGLCRQVFGRCSFGCCRLRFCLSLHCRCRWAGRSSSCVNSRIPADASQACGRLVEQHGSCALWWVRSPDRLRAWLTGTAVGYEQLWGLKVMPACHGSPMMTAMGVRTPE